MSGWTGYMDGYLKQNLEAAKEAVAKDWDMVFIVDGIEGAGKSVIAQQCAKFCDPDFDLSRLAFTDSEFKKAIANAKRFQAVIYDEGFQGLNSRSAMSTVNKSIISMMAEMRQKNLFVFIVLPSFFDLDKNAAIWRSRALLHVYTAEGFERGFFAFFSHEKKKQLYINGKRYYSYKYPRSDFIGRFGKGYVVNEEEYRKRKLKALVSHAEEGPRLSNMTKKHITQRNILLKMLVDRGMTHKELAKALKMGRSSISEAISNNLLEK